MSPVKNAPVPTMNGRPVRASGVRRTKYVPGTEPVAVGKFAWLDAFVGTADISHMELLVGHTIALHANTAGNAVVGFDTLALKAHVKDTKTVKRAIVKLEDKGLLDRQIGGGQGNACVYQLVVPHNHPSLKPVTAAVAAAAAGTLNQLPMLDDIELGPAATLVALLEHPAASLILAAEAAANPVKLEALNSAITGKFIDGWTIEELAKAMGTLPTDLQTVTGLLRHRVTSLTRTGSLAKTDKPTQTPAPAAVAAPAEDEPLYPARQFTRVFSETDEAAREVPAEVAIRAVRTESDFTPEHSSAAPTVPVDEDPVDNGPSPQMERAWSTLGLDAMPNPLKGRYPR